MNNNSGWNASALRALPSLRSGHITLAIRLVSLTHILTSSKLRIARKRNMKFRTPHLKKGNLYIVMKPTPKSSLKSSTQEQCFP